MPALIEMCNVRVRRGDNEVFSEISLQLPSDRSSAVIGPNGSGKSTLLKLINRELYPVWDEGARFNILGRSNWRLEDLHQSMGIVSHDLQERVYRDSTVLQVVISQLYASLTTWAHQSYSPEQIALARHLCEELAIGNLLDRSFAALSTGQQRRCLLARALINEPEYLMLDEPTTGLDIKATHQYLQIMDSLIEKGKKLVLVTHHLHEIPPSIDWFVFLKEGEVIAQGNRRDMFNQDMLGKLFDMPIKLHELEDYNIALPGKAEAD